MYAAYLENPKLPGHHRLADRMIDYKNNPLTDIELKRQRKKYHQLGLTDVKRER